MAISALSFLSDRKRPIVVAVILFIVLSSLFLLFNPTPSALPFFSSPSSHLSSSETSIPVSSNASAPEAPTSVASNGVSSSSSSTTADPVPVSADASPPVTGTAVASDGVGDSTADPPRPDATVDPGDAAADVPQPDHGTSPAAAEESGSAGNNETAAGVSAERDAEGQGGGGAVEEPVELPSWELCEVGKGVVAADYIPCLDNVKAIKALKSLRHMEHRERHCPKPRPRCLVPLPERYRRPVPWPRSRDMVRMPATLR
ncbi:hypothetical protein C2845_PM08G29850 [Panicum miliaceum]|uniref:Methyltransferase n=1 Tax=Panicum miliaceum TaxID=4540 RepID=A0A3L6R0R6_PANMI|nr:hypothetical protein C2845_PM08G29850 [Panicum miliaceum]